MFSSLHKVLENEDTRHPEFCRAVQRLGKGHRKVSGGDKTCITSSPSANTVIMFEQCVCRMRQGVASTACSFRETVGSILKMTSTVSVLKARCNRGGKWYWSLLSVRLGACLPQL